VPQSFRRLPGSSSSPAAWTMPPHVFRVDASSSVPLFTDGPFVETRSTAAASPSWMWPTRRLRGCGRGRSRWPAVGRRKCEASETPGNFQRLLDGVGGRFYCEALPRVLVDATSCFPPDPRHLDTHYRRGGSGWPGSTGTLSAAMRAVRTSESARPRARRRSHLPPTRRIRRAGPTPQRGQGPRRAPEAPRCRQSRHLPAGPDPPMA
jgi:hypothetical protein